MWKQQEFAREKINNSERAITIWALDKKLDEITFVKPREQILVVYENVYATQKDLLDKDAFYCFKMIDGYPSNLFLMPVIDVEYYENVLVLRTTTRKLSDKEIAFVQEECEHLLDHHYKSFDDVYKILKENASVTIPLNAYMHVDVSSGDEGSEECFSPIWHIGSSYSFHVYLDANY
jgi:hypothetical protein